MKILINQTYYLPYISGLTLYSARLAEGLAKRGFPVTALAINHDEALDNYSEINGVKVIRANKLISFGKGLVSFAWFFKAVKQIYITDVVIVNVPQPEGWWVAIWTKLFKKKLIAIYHCDISLENIWYLKLVESMVQSSSKLLAYLANIIVTSTKDYADNSKILKNNKHKIVYSLPPIELSKYSNKEFVNVRNKINKRDIFAVGAVGRWSSEKGYEYLIRAIPDLENSLGKDNFRFVFAGPESVPGEKGYLEKIENLIPEYKEYFQFLGRLSNGELSAFYKLIDVLVIPSVNSTESLGMVQLEAMLCKTPVVVTDLPGVRIPVKETGMGVVVKVRDPKDLARGISNVILNKGTFLKNQNKVDKLMKDNKLDYLIDKII
jgi:glycosyltransferase involved in cell wall biosynthesis